jgi:ribosomal protein S18 acetylase RimI-like enzyme
MTFFSEKKNSAVAADIAQHLRACEAVFYATLAQKVDIEQYANKLALRAHCYEAWREDKLIGLVAAYFNPETKNGYISHVSVLPQAQHQGIAGRLLRQCIAHCEQLCAKQIALEVDVNNIRAQTLYLNHGFIVGETNNANLKMIRDCEIKNEHQQKL